MDNHVGENVTVSFSQRWTRIAAIILGLLVISIIPGIINSAVERSRSHVAEQSSTHVTEPSFTEGYKNSLSYTQQVEEEQARSSSSNTYRPTYRRLSCWHTPQIAHIAFSPKLAVNENGQVLIPYIHRINRRLSFNRYSFVSNSNHSLILNRTIGACPLDNGCGRATTVFLSNESFAMRQPLLTRTPTYYLDRNLSLTGRTHDLPNRQLIPSPSGFLAYRLVLAYDDKEEYNMIEVYNERDDYKVPILLESAEKQINLGGVVYNTQRKIFATVGFITHRARLQFYDRNGRFISSKLIQDHGHEPFSDIAASNDYIMILDRLQPHIHQYTWDGQYVLSVQIEQSTLKIYAIHSIGQSQIAIVLGFRNIVTSIAFLNFDDILPLKKAMNIPIIADSLQNNIIIRHIFFCS